MLYDTPFRSIVCRRPDRDDDGRVKETLSNCLVLNWNKMRENKSQQLSIQMTYTVRYSYSPQLDIWVGFESVPFYFFHTSTYGFKIFENLISDGNICPQ